MTAAAVAEWMLAQVREHGMLEQGVAVYSIHRQFGDQFTYTNANGNLAISKAVLDAFKRLSGDDVIWSRGDRSWRLRQHYDRAGRQQE